MTPLGKVVVITGTVIFTLSAILWIIQLNWRWFAGGLSVFVGCLISAAFLAVETKQPTNHHHHHQTSYYQPQQPTQPTQREPTKRPDHNRNHLQDTQELQAIDHDHDHDHDHDPFNQ